MIECLYVDSAINRVSCETTRFIRERSSKRIWHGASCPAEPDARVSLHLGLPCFPNRHFAMHSSRGATWRKNSLREGYVSVRHPGCPCATGAQGQHKFRHEIRNGEQR